MLAKRYAREERWGEAAPPAMILAQTFHHSGPFSSSLFLTNQANCSSYLKNFSLRNMPASCLVSQYQSRDKVTTALKYLFRLKDSTCISILTELLYPPGKVLDGWLTIDPRGIKRCMPQQCREPNHIARVFCQLIAREGMSQCMRAGVGWH